MDLRLLLESHKCRRHRDRGVLVAKRGAVVAFGASSGEKRKGGKARRREERRGEKRDSGERRGERGERREGEDRGERGEGSGERGEGRVRILHEKKIVTT